MGYTGRTRVLDEETLPASYTLGTGTSTYSSSQRSLQATISASNPGWLRYQRTGLKGPRINMGSAFSTVLLENRNGGMHIAGSNGWPVGSPSYRAVEGHYLPFAASYTGSFNPDPNTYVTSGGMVTVPQPDVDLDPLGATAVSRCAPTNPHASLAVSLAELAHEGLPTSAVALIKGRNRGTLRGAAESNLGLQFGALPLAADIGDFYTSLRDHQRILQQYRRDAGRPIRRRYSFPRETTTTTYGLGADIGPWPSASFAWASYGSISRVRTVTTETWFSGEFVYAPVTGRSRFEGLLSRYRELNHLLGTGVGPGTAWNLLPWSWAVDWFTNVGDVMNNVQMMMNDGLIMSYGFVMRTKRTRDDYVRRGARAQSWVKVPYGVIPVTWEASRTWTFKWRRQANPFGFGINYTALSGRQMSILASLGITRDARVP